MGDGCRIMCKWSGHGFAWGMGGGSDAWHGDGTILGEMKRGSNRGCHRLRRCMVHSWCTIEICLC